MDTIKFMTNLTSLINLNKEHSTALYSPVDWVPWLEPSPLPPAQATPPMVSVEHNAAAVTSPRQTKVKPENDSNLQDMANTRSVDMIIESVVDVQAHKIVAGSLTNLNGKKEKNKIETEALCLIPRLGDIEPHREG